MISVLMPWLWSFSGEGAFFRGRSLAVSAGKADEQHAKQ
jgi:hypothetical protein